MVLDLDHPLLPSNERLGIEAGQPAEVGRLGGIQLLDFHMGIFCFSNIGQGLLAVCHVGVKFFL